MKVMRKVYRSTVEEGKKKKKKRNKVCYTPKTKVERTLMYPIKNSP